MNGDIDQVVERIAALPNVRQAAQAAADLTELWPLTSALHMDNDARYCENLQVRLSRLAAQVMSGERIPMADAEFVYEGADSIPGRPQETVDALNAANDAIETLAGFASSHDVHELLDAADTLDAGWSGATSTAVTTAVGNAEDFVAARTETKVESIAWRYAVVVVLLNELMRVATTQLAGALGDEEPTAGGAPEQRVRGLERLALPFFLFINDFAATLQLPQICLTAEQFHGVVASYATPNGDDDAVDAATVLAQALAPIAGAEWRRHRGDILWDPKEAKERARQEDERKNKEALAAKFAHVKDDPSKPEVEL
ncbi:hypothetical protein [Bifidobacterium choerinum]|uniref:Uncharacterized protein n=1 Tax=Bifidobacterium choerinum TaxID=35760 RepID=A0A2D3D4X5_9BIFI|nr:hypothetical protein [Bifidobacterium choerinum]ATU20148.1 hypothetical protein BcFMB_03500 [Bifidobacterium choerinum]